jgi:DNA segregation ATPase FtsK/SpoIIIE-like protein
LKAGKPGSPQRRTYTKLYQQWLKSRGAEGSESAEGATTESDKSEIQRLQDKIKSLQDEMKQKTPEQVVQEKPQQVEEKLQDKKQEIQLVQGDQLEKKDFQKDVQTDVTKKQEEKSDTVDKKYQDTLQNIRNNEGKLPININFLQDPPPPSKVKTDMVARHTDGLNSAFKALNIDASVVDFDDSPNVLTYNVKIDVDSSDARYITQRNKLSSSSINDTIGSMVRQEGVTVAEDKERGVFKVSIPKGKKIGEGRDPVLAKELLASDAFVNKAKSITKLPSIIGKDSDNNPLIIDFSSSATPHFLVCGTSGSGKSVLINSMIMSNIVGKTPEQVKIVLIDAVKRGAEFGAYDDVAHLAMPVVKDESGVVDAVNKVHKETEERYERLSNIKVGGVPVKNIESFNTLVTKDQSKMTDDEKSAYNSIPEKDRKVMPYIQVYIDEAADLLKNKQFGKDIKRQIDSTLKIARAAGVHIVLASQSPAAETIDGTLQANLGAKIMLRLTKQSDADNAGVSEATDLLDNGDGVYVDASGKKRIQSAYASDAEIAKVVQQARGKQNFIQQETEADKKQIVQPIDTSEFQQYRQNLEKTKEHLQKQREKIERVLEESESEEKKLQERRENIRQERMKQKEKDEQLSDIDKAREKRITQQTQSDEKPEHSEIPEFEPESESFEPESSFKQEDLLPKEEPAVPEQKEILPEDQVNKEIEELTSGKPVTEHEIKNKKSDLKSMLDRIKKMIGKKKV